MLTEYHILNLSILIFWGSVYRHRWVLYSSFIKSRQSFQRDIWLKTFIYTKFVLSFLVYLKICASFLNNVTIDLAGYRSPNIHGCGHACMFMCANLYLLWLCIIECFWQGWNWCCPLAECNDAEKQSADQPTLHWAKSSCTPQHKNSLNQGRNKKMNGDSYCISPMLSS